MNKANEISVSGTLIWYYFICQREVWLMARKLTPDQQQDNILIGKHIAETSYQRDKKEIDLGHIKLDLVRVEDGKVIVGEVKKSSSSAASARMQLAYYLAELEKKGIVAEGELMFPKEKKKEKVVLDEELRKQLALTEQEILKIIYAELPPKPKRIKFCRACAYSEFCWA